MTSFSLSRLFIGRPRAAATAALGTTALFLLVTKPTATAASKPEPKNQQQQQQGTGDIVLYQYDACPFCNKVKAFLDLNRMPYSAVEVDPMRKGEIQWSSYKKVPLAVIDGVQVNGSSEIITSLLPRAGLKEPQGEEKRWFDWVDSSLVHALTVNIYRTPGESLQAFDYITTTGNFSALNATWIKYSGAAAMYAISHLRLKKRHGITDERAALYRAADEWVAAVQARGGGFHGGARPDLADTAVYGVLRSIKGLDTEKDLKSANPQLVSWMGRMEKVVGPSMRSTVKVVQAPDFKATLTKIEDEKK
jgi:microsomal prostaglandin-E synthase 2